MLFSHLVANCVVHATFEVSAGSHCSISYLHLIPSSSTILIHRQAAEADGKAHNNLLKLQMFRRFYIMVIVYIYFTRIAVYLIEATVPFYMMWTGPLAHEIATLVFFIITGYQFRPAIDNPYLPVSSEDFEGKEYGLDDDAFDAQVDVEMIRKK